MSKRGAEQREGAEADAPTEAQTEEIPPPGPVVVAWPIGFEARAAEHPEFDVLCSMNFDLPGAGSLQVNMPMQVAGVVAAKTLELVEVAMQREAGRQAGRTAGGLVLPGGVDIEQEAAASRAIRGGKS